MNSEKIKQANGRLKVAGIRIQIQAIGNSLYLVGTLPPKPDSSRTDDYQQRIALGLKVNPANVQLAEREARKVGVWLDCETFSWEPYLRSEGVKPELVADWLARFEAEYRDTVQPVTWKCDYHNAFKKLPQDKPLTYELLKSVVDAQRSNSKTRRRCALAFTRLARFSGLQDDFKAIQGTYSAAAVEPRDLPTDRTVAEWFGKIDDPGWRWVYGVIATFGLRNHEVFFLNLDDLASGGDSVFVLEGKTGARQVWAYYPEWIDQFHLRQPLLPAVTVTNHDQGTQRVCKFFGRLQAPFTALDLRHCWAVRTLMYGLPYELAAKQMGHSMAVHEKTYHRWITADTHQRMHDALKARHDRILAPSITAAE